MRNFATLQDIRAPEVRAKFETYPAPIRTKMLRLRRLILETARDHDVLDSVQESLKWGEPSYLSKGGSAVRIDWKPDSPRQYAMYFQCQTSLVATFREVHGSKLEFEGNRAIVFKRAEALPVGPVKHCVSLALRYHSLKRLPLLGA